MLLSTDEQFSKIFDCRDCDFEERAARGCLEPVNLEAMPDGVWEIQDACLHCSPYCRPFAPDRELYIPLMRYIRNEDDVEETECEHCRGSNRTTVDRCPRTVASADAYWLLPFFFDHFAGRRNGVSVWPYPGGRMKQMTWIVRAFDLLSMIAIERDIGAPQKATEGH